MRKRIKKSALVATKFSSYLLACTLLTTGLWITRKFGEPNFEQILYHLRFGSSGLIEADAGLVRNFIKHCLLIPIAISLALYSYEKFILTIKNRGLANTRKKFGNFFPNYLKKYGVLIYRVSLKIFVKHLPILLIVLASLFFLTKISFWGYLKNLEHVSFLDENYRTPSEVIAPKIKKNLVLIYVESLENTYSNKSLFEEDLLASINSRTAQSTSFKNFRQTTGTGWTIAGIVSTMCGIPLKPIALFDGNQQGEQINHFLPGAICLGDILKDAGYQNIFMGGASLSFSGKGKFLKEHGYDELYGADEWRGKGAYQFNEWGIYDDALLKNAKIKVAELERRKTPFNLTILTVDTHFPNGYISPTCEKNGVNQFTGIVKCTSDLISDFIVFMEKNGYLKNTEIVILGDHLSMTNAVYDQLLKEENRTIFNRFISTEMLRKNREDIYHFDMFPTILYSLGFRFKNNKLGLGASGFGSLESDNQIRTLDSKTLSELLSKQSYKYSEFWEFR